MTNYLKKQYIPLFRFLFVAFNAFMILHAVNVVFEAADLFFNYAQTDAEKDTIIKSAVDQLAASLGPWANGSIAFSAPILVNQFWPYFPEKNVRAKIDPKDESNASATRD